MSPRTLSANGKDGFKHVAKMKRRAAEQADRDGAPMAVVSYQGNVFIRPLPRALRLLEKHRREGAKIVARFMPGGEAS
jgi:hypothetical protein